MQRHLDIIMIAVVKRKLRQSVNSLLQHLSDDVIEKESLVVSSLVTAHPAFKSATSVCSFLSMPRELHMAPINEALFAQRKRCFVPRIRDDGELDMLEAFSMNDIAKFPTNKWHIPEPPAEDKRAEARAVDSVSLVLVPGLAFDALGNRLGRGKGYYDKYLKSLILGHQQQGLPPPVLLGVCLSCQMVDAVPMADYDVKMTAVISPLVCNA